MTQHKSFLPYVVLNLVLGLAVIALTFGVGVRVTDESGVSTNELPDQVGEWTGERLLYCGEVDCREVFRGDRCIGLTTCPACGGQVTAMSYDEKVLLPKDTFLLRKVYRHPSGDEVFAAVVLSGGRRDSLHRPQVCLTSDGQDIVDTHVIKIEMDGSPPLRVKVLDLLKTSHLSDGRTVRSASYYAYWFAAKDHETPYLLARMVWMAADKVLFSKTGRWAYISVAGGRNPKGSDYLNEMTHFVQSFYPMIREKKG